MWRKLVIVPVEQLRELRRWLDEAEVQSSETPEGYGGPTEGPDALLPEANRTVWVTDGDLERATEVAQSFLKEMKDRATRDKCQQCGYDLRAHSGPGRCAECGHSFDLPQRDFIRKCVNCGEEVPGDFEICWNCGVGM
jgi:hypothetical protein